MSGKRCKALRREFKNRTGLTPGRAVTELVLRKRSWLGKIFGVYQTNVVTESEWRKIKKEYRRKQSAKAVA